MTEEQKKILLKDLSARVPYRPKFITYALTYDKGVNVATDIVRGIVDDSIVGENGSYRLDKSMLFLRPMSTMTEAERKVYDKLSRMDDEYSQPHDSSHLVDWLNEHHFDHRGLIGMGLATPAPEGMYDNKNN